MKSTSHQTFTTADAEVIFEHLARHGILVRLFREASLIRIGIAADHEWKYRMYCKRGIQQPDRENPMNNEHTGRNERHEQRMARKKDIVDEKIASAQTEKGLP